MKSALQQLFGSVWSGLATGLIIGVAAVVPVMTSADTAVELQGSLRAANVTNGDANYKEAITASREQTVKLQVYYQNNTTDTANAVRVKISLPGQAGIKQTISTTVKGPNSNELKDEAVITTDSEQAVLQYVPGTAVWRHNVGSNEEPKVEETKLSDEVVVGAQGVVVEDQKPGETFGSSISIQAKVMVPGVKVSNESQVKGDVNKWSGNNTAKATDTMRYIVGYQNTSNATQTQVVIRNVLPTNMALVAGSTTLYNNTNPGGVKLGSNAISAGGVVIGNYGPGANAYVTFEATFAADKLTCGNNEFRNIGYVRPQGLGEYFSSTVTTVNKDCSAQPTPTPNTQSSAPVYSCDKLTLAKGDNRKLTAKVDYTAKQGASLKLVKYDFGDSTQPLTTDKVTTDHTYAKDGEYTVTVTLTFSVNDKDMTATGAACTQQVSFAPASTTPATPAATTPSGDLPNSGPGDMAALFVGVSVIGFALHRLVFARRFAD